MCASVAVRFLIPMKGGKLLKNTLNQKEERISDKAFNHKLLASVISILVCLFALGSYTYAWFNAGTSSGENVLTSGNFALDISVDDLNGEQLSVVDEGYGKYSCTFDYVGTYTVSLTMTADSNATKGYCDVIFASSAKKHTALISRDPSLGVELLTFTIEVTNAGLTVGFTPKWGIPAHAEIYDGDAISELGEVIVSEDNT